MLVFLFFCSILIFVLIVIDLDFEHGVEMMVEMMVEMSGLTTAVAEPVDGLCVFAFVIVLGGVIADLA